MGKKTNLTLTRSQYKRDSARAFKASQTGRVVITSDDGKRRLMVLSTIRDTRAKK